MQTIHPKENAAWLQKKGTSFSKEHGVTEFCSLGNAKMTLKIDFHKTSLQDVILSLPVMETSTCGTDQDMQVIPLACQS